MNIGGKSRPELFGKWHWIFAAFILAPGVTRGVPAPGQKDVPEHIMAAVQADPRVRDILADFPEVHLEPRYAQEFGVWIIRFVQTDKGSLGLISVGAETGEILEFSFNAERTSESRQRMSDDERAGEREPGLLRVMLPRFEGMPLAWLSFMLVAILLGRFSKPLSWRNLDILLLYALAPFLQITWTHTRIAYSGLFIVTSILLARCLWIAVRPGEELPQPNVGNRRVVWMLLALALIMHVLTLYESHIGDAGLWSAIGGQYLLRTGRLPYGTEFGPNCVYGPLTYVLFAPAGAAASFIREIGPDGSIVLVGFGDLSAMRPVQTTVLILDLITLLALYRLARCMGGHETALTLVFVYAISPYLLGMASELGLERPSHVAAAPLILLALVLLSRPAFAGILLGIAAGMLYYPIFLAPLWFGYVRRKGTMRRGLLFLTSFAAVGTVCIVMLMVAVKPIDDTRSPLGAFFNDTIAQQQFKTGYGNSPLSFWGQYPELAAWGKPMAGMLYCLFCFALAFLPRRIDFNRLIALTAAVLVGTQLVLSFGGGSYIGFYLAPLVLTLFGNQSPTLAEVA